MEEKKRFKMYKSGKNWVIAPIVFLGLTAGLGHQANVKADNVSSTAKADNETTQKATSTSLNDQKAVTLKSSTSTKATTQATAHQTAQARTQIAAVTVVQVLQQQITANRQRITSSSTTNNNQKPATQTATSNIQYKVTAVYDAPGVDNVTVPDALKVGDVVKDMPSSVPTSVSGTKGDKLSTSDLNKVANAIGSNGVDGTQSQKSVQYPNGKGHYFYKYYVQQGFDVTKANENVTYGSPITVNVTATLTWAE